MESNSPSHCSSQGVYFVQSFFWLISFRHAEIVQLLISRGASVRDMNDNPSGPQSALQLAVTSSSQGAIETVEILLQNGADPSLKENGYDSFNRAIFNVKIYQLLKKNKQLPAGNETGLLIDAVNQNQLEMVKELLNGRPSVTANYSGYSALHAAVQKYV